MHRIALVSLLLRIGLAVVFLYAAVASMLEPSAWIGFFPQFLQDIFSPGLLLLLFSLYQAFLALWLLSGIKIAWSALLASATIFTIVVANYRITDIIFRDIAIFFAALALVFLHRNTKGGDTI